jgi:hypothetical protein
VRGGYDNLAQDIDQARRTCTTGALGRAGSSLASPCHVSVFSWRVTGREMARRLRCEWIVAAVLGGRDGESPMNCTAFGMANAALLRLAAEVADTMNQVLEAPPWRWPTVAGSRVFRGVALAVPSAGVPREGCKWRPLSMIPQSRERGELALEASCGC